MRFVIVDRAARRIAGQMSLKRSDFGVGANGSFFNPLHVDDEVQVMITATAPVSATPKRPPSQHARLARPVRHTVVVAAAAAEVVTAPRPRRLQPQHVDFG
jgi:hypothetical protein